MNKEFGNKIAVNIFPMREIAIGKKLKIRVRIPKELGKSEKCTILLNRMNEGPSIVKELKRTTKEENNYEEYRINLRLNKFGNYFFFFMLQIDGQERAIKINRATGEAYFTNGESPYWRIYVKQSKNYVPEWSKGAIFYQIFVDRFYKSENVGFEKQTGRNYRIWGQEVNWHKNEKGLYHNNDFFGGNLRGIEEKLEYIKSLGVGVIYLSPINKSLGRYERYAATSHMEIDPDVGTFEDLERLHKKALKLGMHIILDIAFNHCCVDNPIFQDALKNPKSKYRDWFKRDRNGNIMYWYGFDDMPEFNQNSKGYQNYVYGPNGVVAKYSQYVDGFRLDLADCLQPFFLEGIRNRANKNGAHFIVGEYWQDVDVSILGNGVDAPTCYPLTNAILKFLAYGESDYLERKMKELVEKYPQNTIDTMLVSLGTHDIIRPFTVLGKTRYMKKGYSRIWEIDQPPTPWHRDGNFYTQEFREFESMNDELTQEEYEHAKRLMKIGMILRDFYLGNPCIFYGTEVGLSGWKDPFNRKCFPWGKEDQELLQYQRDIGAFRNCYKSQNSNPKVIYKDSEVFIFKRENKYNSLLVAVNRGNQIRKIELPEEFKKNNHLKFTLNDSTEKQLLPYGGIVIIHKK